MIDLGRWLGEEYRVPVIEEEDEDGCSTPPGATPLLVKGEVIWINPYRPDDSDQRNPGMGIRFVSLTARQRDAIGHLVRTFAYLDDDQEAPCGRA